MSYNIKRLKWIMPVLFLALLLNDSFAQQKTVRLKNGEQVPDIEFPVIINSLLTHAKLTDFKGKIVVLDYWALWCGSCIEKLPELGRLQKQFKDKVVILPVSFLHKKEAIRQFVQKRKETSDAINLPLAIFENTDNKLFRLLPANNGYPNIVFIDQQGKLIQTSIAVDSTMLSRLIKGQKTGSLSNDHQMNFNKDAPFLLSGNGGPDTAFSYRSLITGYKDSLKFNIQSSQFDKKQSRLLYINTPVLELVKTALRNGISMDPFNHFVVFEGVNLSSLIFKGKSELERESWLAKNVICYDLVLPSSFKKQQAFEMMRQDLERYFQITTSIEKRQMDCYVLSRIDTIDRLKSSSTRASATRSEDGLSVNFKKVKIDYLASFIADKSDDPIIVDETSYKGNIDIDIKIGKTFNPELLNGKLKNYGLELTSAKRGLEVVVIKNRRD